MFLHWGTFAAAPFVLAGLSQTSWVPAALVALLPNLTFQSSVMQPDHKVKLAGTACAMCHLSRHDLTLNAACFSRAKRRQGLCSVTVTAVVLLRAVLTRK